MDTVYTFLAQQTFFTKLAIIIFTIATLFALWEWIIAQAFKSCRTTDYIPPTNNPHDKTPPTPLRRKAA